MAFRRGDASNAPPSPVGDGDFQQRVEIDMAALIGSAIGNVSISRVPHPDITRTPHLPEDNHLVLLDSVMINSFYPYNRDVVLAARKGLYIIDLESPFDLPRFIPQGGTWDVADVQWNPHLSRSEYIVSTSGEKLLIWNLNIVAKSNIEHVLRGHYRAVTDINWHPAEPDVLVSTGIDSWVWEWDIRTPLKAVMGKGKAGGTQVKWNRQDGNVLASSHQNEVLIWDRRKGSLPVSRIKAHSAKIYGIDWSYQNRQQIVTCSLDKTIKSWDINQIPTDGDECKPNTIIEPGYPVWRARNMPFGSGILSVPQRGQTALDMWNLSASTDPVQRFEGHTDVVKEFVWRRRRRDDDASFQLITWSKDRTLRFWPINSDIMEKAGGKTIHAPYTPADESISYSMRPSAPATIPKLSTPAASRGILGEVRASEILWPKPRFTEEAFRPQETHGASATGPTKVYGEPGLTRRGMIGKLTQVTPASWIANVKLGGNKRDGSSGHGSGGDGSRLNSLSRPPSTKDDEPREREVKTDSEDEAEAMTQSLQEEITSVLNKLASYKVRLEKAEFGKRPTCTFGLHGPWGESTSVFVRVTFTFPHSYSSNVGIPNCELEPNPLITMGSRVFMARRLFSIRKNRRPCLEPCLRFLLFGHEDSHSITRTAMDDDESSSEDEAYPAIRRPRNGSHSPVRENKNLAEPRTSQGVFSPNGQLVCFFRAPPRIVKGSGPREPSKSPSLGSRRPESAPRLFALHSSYLMLSDDYPSCSRSRHVLRRCQADGRYQQYFPHHVKPIRILTSQNPEILRTITAF
ncbi:hypothetical protein QCA50_007298 [Cerrena zonata]|uniref:Uncharacterized protein n=1 Tax=Cerrena zonata TaxID=2478898 RepID=A0AAW0GJ57_9APHY